MPEAGEAKKADEGAAPGPKKYKLDLSCLSAAKRVPSDSAPGNGEKTEAAEVSKSIVELPSDATGASKSILSLPPEVVSKAVAKGIPLSDILSGAVDMSEFQKPERKRREFTEDPPEDCDIHATFGPSAKSRTLTTPLVRPPVLALPPGPVTPGAVPVGTVSAVAMSPNCIEKPATCHVPANAYGISIDSQIQAMLDCMRRGLPNEALHVAQTRLTGKPGIMSVNQFAKLVQSVAVRADIDEMQQFLSEMVDMMALIDFPDEAGKAYFKRFIRWTVREILACGASALEQTTRHTVETLMSFGQSVSPMSAELGLKAGNELKLTYSGTLPQGHNFARGDWVFVTFPAEGAVCGSTDQGQGSLTFEGELVTALIDRAPATIFVKLVGIAKDKLDKFNGQQCRVDRAANRVTYHRQVDAIKFFGASGKNDIGWIRQVVLASDETGLLAGSGFEAALCSGVVQGIIASTASSPLWSLANSSQKEALSQALQRKLTLVQGPPGSGKTHTAILLIRLWLASQRGPVLAVADSNVAVDNLLDGCAKAGLEVLRVGRPESTRPDLERYNLLERAAALTTGLLGRLNGEKASHSDQNVWVEEKRLLQKAQVVCATCSGADHPVLQGFEFASIIIDEAAQATEPSTLVPFMRLHAVRGSCVLIGDHRQLPPTVVDIVSEKEGLNVPFFDRMAKRGVEPIMLNIQYRMHPAIAQFPSTRYYAAKLRSGVRGKKRPAPAGINWPDARTPVCFLPVEGREVPEGTSYLNYAEIGAIESLLDSILSAGDIAPEDIGIITPYAAQVRLVRRTLNYSPALARHNCRSTRPGEIGLEVSSVDGFQGREKELIIVSTVRANETGLVGFLSDHRRMNVTITRARRGLLVCGHFGTLSQDANGWRPWLSWAQERGLVAGCAATAPRKAQQLVMLSELSEEQLIKGHI